MKQIIDFLSFYSERVGSLMGISRIACPHFIMFLANLSSPFVSTLLGGRGIPAVPGRIIMFRIRVSTPFCAAIAVLRTSPPWCPARRIFALSEETINRLCPAKVGRNDVSRVGIQDKDPSRVGALSDSTLRAKVNDLRKDTVRYEHVLNWPSLSLTSTGSEAELEEAIKSIATKSLKGVFVSIIVNCRR